ncbi:MAG TPA: hypothetical protein VFA26_20220 [Gemmataceae bacterium]|nr:hypothetical protein [Gemmataceae bacterium]
MRRAVPFALCLVALSPLAPCRPPACQAAPPVETDPNKEYPVVAEAGPWMVCAATYTGPDSQKMAKEIVLLLRKRDHLPAYVFNRGEEERRKQREEVERLRRTLPEGARIPMHRIEDQCVVLVGGYPDMDAARRALDDIRKLAPPPEHLMDRVATAQPQTGPDGSRGIGVQHAYLNPFRFRSMVVPNPLVPVPRANKANDAFLKQLNADEDYSLLKCPRPWTLAVAEYAGASTTQSRAAPTNPFLEALGFGGKSTDALSASGMMAHEVARVLRQMKLEAYVLHTRHSSVVAVGGFDSQNDPRMREVVQRVQALRQQQVARTGSDPMQLFAQPVPMPVPRPGA